MKQEIDTRKGITLISLVITIIVLLILATVAINIAVDSDGLFTRAGQAANKWNESVTGEKSAIENVMLIMNEIQTGETTTPEEPEEPPVDPSDWDFDPSTGTIKQYIGEDFATIEKLTIPNQIDGKDVTKIKPSSTNIMGQKDVALQEVIIPEGITEIRKRCF